MIGRDGDYDNQWYRIVICWNWDEVCFLIKVCVIHESLHVHFTSVMQTSCSDYSRHQKGLHRYTDIAQQWLLTILSESPKLVFVARVTIEVCSRMHVYMVARFSGDSSATTRNIVYICSIWSAFNHHSDTMTPSFSSKFIVSDCISMWGTRKHPDFNYCRRWRCLPRTNMSFSDRGELLNPPHCTTVLL